MELLRPAARRIQLSCEDEEIEGEALFILRRNDFASARLLKNRRRLLVGAVDGGAAVKAVVGKAGTGRMKVIVTLLQRGEQIRKVMDGDTGNISEAIKPKVEEIRPIDLKSLVRAECG